MWKKIRRYRNNLKNESDPKVARDMKVIITGMTNFYGHNRKANELAKERYENHCSTCSFFISDPVESEKVMDKDIPALSGKICSMCSCTLSYKLRQSIKPCEFWK